MQMRGAKRLGHCDQKQAADAAEARVSRPPSCPSGHSFCRIAKAVGNTQAWFAELLGQLHQQPILDYLVRDCPLRSCYYLLSHFELCPGLAQKCSRSSLRRRFSNPSPPRSQPHRILANSWPPIIIVSRLLTPTSASLRRPSASVGFGRGAC